MDFDLRAHTHLLAVAGSRAYGIHTASSDVDVKGVAVPPSRYFHGYLKRFEQADKASEMGVFLDVLDDEERAVSAATKLEGSVYEVRKFVTLAADCNPNILDVLFCRDEEVRVLTPLGRRLRDARELFVSAKAKHTFTGYAAAQLKRIRGHRAWLLDPPTRPPTRAEHGLPENTLLPADQLAAAQAAVKKQIDRWEIDFGGMADSEVVHVQDQLSRHLAELHVALGYKDVDDAKWVAAARTVGLDDNLIYVMQREREYEAAARYWRQYSEWRSSRNADRAALEAKHGYDTKHAGHLVRLLRMGREILETGKVHVWRGPGGPGDAQEIRDIRAGRWSYDELVAWADAQEKEIDRIYAERRYVVPKQADREAIDRLCVGIVEAAIAE